VGASALDLTPDLAAAFGVGDASGALIGSMVPAGPAAKAGLVPGDIITSVGGKAIADARTFQRRVGETEPGTPLKVALMRKGQALQSSIVVGARPSDRKPAVAQPAALRARLGLGTASAGLHVRSVGASSPAAEADVRVGDLVVEVGQRGVSGTQAVKDLLRNERAAGKRFALLTVSRGGVTLFKALRLSESHFDTALSVTPR
jgi:serine protease Do